MEKKNENSLSKAVEKIESANFKLGKAARLVGQALELFQNGCSEMEWDDMITIDIESALAKLGYINGQCMEYLHECKLELEGKLDSNGICDPKYSIDAL